MLKEEGRRFWDKATWPPSSPDCTVLDYAIWDHISGVACKEAAPSIDVLKQRVNAAWNAMIPAFVRKCFSGFRRRLEAVIAADGGRIE